jgi:hypothetical protein
MYTVKSVLYRCLKYTIPGRFIRYLAEVELNGNTGKVRIDRVLINGQGWTTTIYSDIPGFSSLENPLNGIEGVEPMSDQETPDVLIELGRLQDYPIS